MKKLLSILLSAVCLASVCASGISAAEITTTDAAAGKAATVPVIDGVYDPAEGWGAPVVTIKNPDTAYLSLCATDHPEFLEDKDLIPSLTNVYFRWDEKNFYYCATLVQEKRFNNRDWLSAAACWQGDSVSFNIKSTLDTDEKTRWLFALTQDDGPVYYEESSEDPTISITTYDAWKISRNEETKVTTYEIYIPWEDIIPDGEMKAGDVFYFRDLYMPAVNETYQNPVDFNTAGITPSGSYSYWKITLSEDGEAAAEETVVEEPAAEEAVVEEPAVEETVEEPAVEEAVVEEPAVEEIVEEAVVEAPQTFDLGVIAAVSAIISAVGYAISKKR